MGPCRPYRPCAWAVTGRSSWPAASSRPYLPALSAEAAGLVLASLTPTHGSSFGTDSGVLVLRAPTDDVFKLQDGDVIVSIGGREPMNGAHATRILSTYGPGERLVLKVVRHRRRMTLEITLPRPAAR